MQLRASFPILMRLRRTCAFPFSIVAAASTLVSCSAATAPETFERSGEMIALSGGEAGPLAACHTCHGLDGGGDGALVPRIAGFNAGYLARQLEFYAEGQRRHPQMSWLAGRLDSGARMAVADYYAGMPLPGAANAELPAETLSCDPGDAAKIYHAGVPERDLAACASCHGPAGEGVGEGNPALAGQSAAYLAEQLHRWRDGQRYGDPLDVMHDAANALHRDEITPLAEYIADGPGRSRRPGSREECP